MAAKSNFEGNASEAGATTAECFRGGTEKELENALKNIAHISADDVNMVMKRILMQVFSQEELITCNRKGEKTVQAGENGPKPALVERKLNLVESVVFTKCPQVTKDNFPRKFDNILKVVRRKNKLH